MAALNPRAVAPVAADAPAVVLGGTPQEPRYEAPPAPGKHHIIEDPDSHVRYCSKCDTPEHMTAGDDCVPRG